MKTWYCSYSQKGDEVNLAEYPWWAAAPQALVEDLDTVVLRHNWCSPPEWTWKLPLHWKRDEEGHWETSVGSVVWDSFQKVYNLTDDFWRKHAKVLKAPVTEEWLRANDLWPDWRDDDDE